MEKWVCCEKCDAEVCIDFYLDAVTVTECDDGIEAHDEFECSVCGHEIHLTAYFTLTGYAIEGGSE